MPVCPFCGEESKPESFFEQVWETSDGNRKERGALIVCPGCDVVLGGGTDASAWATL